MSREKAKQRHTVFVLLEDTTPVLAYDDKTEAHSIRHFFRVRDETDLPDQGEREDPVYLESGGKQGYKVRTANGGPGWLQGETWQLSSFFARPNYVTQQLIPTWPTITPTSDRIVGRFWGTTGIPVGMEWDENEVPPEGSVVLYGNGPPDAALGNNGDYYVDNSRLEIYGPKQPETRGGPRAASTWGAARDQYTGTAQVQKPAWLKWVAPLVPEYDAEGNETGNRQWDGDINDQIGHQKWFGESFMYWAKC